MRVFVCVCVCVCVRASAPALARGASWQTLALPPAPRRKSAPWPARATGMRNVPSRPCTEKKRWSIKFFTNEHDWSDSAPPVDRRIAHAMLCVAIRAHGRTTHNLWPHTNSVAMARVNEMKRAHRSRAPPPCACVPSGPALFMKSLLQNFYVTTAVRRRNPVSRLIGHRVTRASLLLFWRDCGRILSSSCAAGGTRPHAVCLWLRRRRI